MKTWQALAWALFLGWGGAATAQSTSAPAAQAALLRPDTLRAEPFADAAAVMTVWPLRLRMAATLSRMSSLSSTTRILPIATRWKSYR